MQSLTTIEYKNRTLEFYQDYFNSKSDNDLKKFVKKVKLPNGTNSEKKKLSKEVSLFVCNIASSSKAGNKMSSFRIGVDDIFNTSSEGTYSINMAWMMSMNTRYANYCFNSGTTALRCAHVICNTVNTEMFQITQDVSVLHPFLEFMYTNMNYVFVRNKQTIKVPIFDNSDITRKLTTPFLKLMSNGNIVVSCNYISLVAGQNTFQIDIPTSMNFEVSVLACYSANIYCAQIINGCLILLANHSADIRDDIGALNKNLVAHIPENVDASVAKICNIRIQDFKAQTYPIRFKTDSNIACILRLFGLRSCDVSLKIQFSDVLNNGNHDNVNRLIAQYEQIAKYLNPNEGKSHVARSFSDLDKCNKILTHGAQCSNCGKKLADNCNLSVLSCWDVICNECLAGSCHCPCNIDHRSVTPIHIFTIVNYSLFYNLINQMTAINIDDFNSYRDDRVFSYTFPHNKDCDNSRLLSFVTNALDAYSKTTHNKLKYYYSFTECLYLDNNIFNFNFHTQFPKQDNRQLTCVIFKPTAYDVTIINKFMSVFKRENVLAVDFKTLDFSDDNEYAKVYRVNNKYVWNRYWRDYLESDLGLVFMCRVPSIGGFAKAIAHTRASVGYPWTKNSIHRSSDIKEANQNLLDFFPDYKPIEQESSKRKLEESDSDMVTEFFEDVTNFIQSFDD